MAANLTVADLFAGKARSYGVMRIGITHIVGIQNFFQPSR